ncbi:MAG TPA: PepSY domain-containing protein [Xanthomonadales bacterium]|nr:PepSY domain-containing protein [Xanthomonadales bacterium]
MARKKLTRSLTRRQHRTIGITVSVFVLFMVISGLALNHTNALLLDQQKVTAPGLLDWYGLEAPEQVLDFAVHPQWLSFADSRWYLDGVPVADASDGIGAVAAGDWLLAADAGGLLILTRQGDVVERQPWSNEQRGRIEALGRAADGSVAVRTEENIWITDEELLDWSPGPDRRAAIRWARPANAPEAVRKAIVAAHRGQGISLERVLVDLHSGRFFGRWGVLIYDLFAFALAFLALGGLVLWFRGRRNGSRVD